MALTMPSTNVNCFLPFCPNPKTNLLYVNLPEFPWTVYIYFDGINSLLWSDCSTPYLKKTEIRTYCKRPISIK